MSNFRYEGIDPQGRPIKGSTSGANKQEVISQLRMFGFTKIRIKEEADAPAQTEEVSPDGSVQKPVDGETLIDEPVSEDEEDEDEWRRAEAFARTRALRRRENIILIVLVVVLGCMAIYIVYNRITRIEAPQPKIITYSTTEMLSFKDVYVRDPDLVFVIFGRDWNGNVKVDFEAWDPQGSRIDFGTKRLGFVGEHFGGAPEKSGAFKLKKYRFYDKIVIAVSGDEGK